MQLQVRVGDRGPDSEGFHNQGLVQGQTEPRGGQAGPQGDGQVPRLWPGIPNVTQGRSPTEIPVLG